MILPYIGIYLNVYIWRILSPVGSWKCFFLFIRYTAAVMHWLQWRAQFQHRNVVVYNGSPVETVSKGLCTCIRYTSMQDVKAPPHRAQALRLMVRQPNQRCKRQDRGMKEVHTIKWELDAEVEPRSMVLLKMHHFEAWHIQTGLWWHKMNWDEGRLPPVYSPRTYPYLSHMHTPYWSLQFWQKCSSDEGIGVAILPQDRGNVAFLLCEVVLWAGDVPVPVVQASDQTPSDMVRMMRVGVQIVQSRHPQEVRPEGDLQIWDILLVCANQSQGSKVVYQIPFSRGKTCIGETIRRLETRMKEPLDACYRRMVEKSAVAEHTWKHHQPIEWEAPECSTDLEGLQSSSWKKPSTPR